MRDRPALVWLVAALVVACIHPFVPGGRWLMVHLVVLGALTHSIMVWSTHFAQALLKTPPTLDDRTQQNRRLVGLMVGVVCVVVGVPSQLWWLTVVGATIASLAVLWHAVQLVRRLRGALPGRYRLTVFHYVAASLCLPLGATFGVLLARQPADPWHGQLLVAHTMTMLLGWVGLTVVGTLTTLWPTSLRTRMDERAQRWAAQAFPVLVVAMLGVIGSALLGIRLGVTAYLALYIAALLWWGRGLWRPWRQSPPRELAPVSLLMALVWGLVGLVTLAVTAARVDDWAQISTGYTPVTVIAVVGFTLQLLIGALSVLIPAVLGGGPSVVRAGGEWFDRWAALRLVVINVGLAVCLLPVTSVAKVLVSLLVLVALASFLPLMVGAIRASVAARREVSAQAAQGGFVPTGVVTEGISITTSRGQTASVVPPRPQRLRPVQAVAGLAAVALATALGSAIATGPSSFGGMAGGTAAAPVAAAGATGEVTRVTVEAQGMRFTPERIEVPRGNRLEIELVNADPTQPHDLTLATGARTTRLAPGARETLDAGVITAAVEGWCSIIGHRQAGMTLQIVPTGTGTAGDTSASGDPAKAADAQASVDAQGSSAASGHLHGGTAVAGSLADRGIDLMAEPDRAFERVDPVLPTLSADGIRTHRLTLTATEIELEVAPGVWQKRWAFNGRVPGPTLHGRVGDRFEVTLVNDGSMGHSIDFHAGALAPDEPMRTIAPGERLVYTFTAERAGIWMYHCSTMPMSAHIAAGMHGAVVIEPEGLPQVDRQYVLVQGETYLGASTEKGSASEVDVDALAAEKPTLVAFNGIAAQYDHRPLEAKVGERVRFWVLDAGPNRALSFHVVGGQFDTVWTEGTYQLRRGEGALGGRGGGAQVLPLLAAQGGFVELEFPEAGHYPVVNHQMVDAERGAHGVVEVTD